LAGTIPLKHRMPAIAVAQISGVEQHHREHAGGASAACARSACRSRSRDGYPEQKQLIELVRTACRNRQRHRERRLLDSILPGGDRPGQLRRRRRKSTSRPSTSSSAGAPLERLKNRGAFRLPFPRSQVHFAEGNGHVVPAIQHHRQAGVGLTAALDLTSAVSNLNVEVNTFLDNGTGANQANQVFSDTRTLTTGANETLDLNGSLLNAAGESVTFTKIKVIYIRNKGTTTLSIGGAAATQFVAPFGSATDLVKIPPGGILLLTAPDANGFACRGRATDSLKILNSAGASIDYDIVLIGVN
jgi:hypothetical protein